MKTAIVLGMLGSVEVPAPSRWRDEFSAEIAKWIEEALTERAQLDRRDTQLVEFGS
jgi:hypothetical protein